MTSVNAGELEEENPDLQRVLFEYLAQTHQERQPAPEESHDDDSVQPMELCDDTPSTERVLRGHGQGGSYPAEDDYALQMQRAMEESLRTSRNTGTRSGLTSPPPPDTSSSVSTFEEDIARALAASLKDVGPQRPPSPPSAPAGASAAPSVAAENLGADESRWRSAEAPTFDDDNDPQLAEALRLSLLEHESSSGTADAGGTFDASLEAPSWERGLLHQSDQLLTGLRPSAARTAHTDIHSQARGPGHHQPVLPLSQLHDRRRRRSPPPYAADLGPFQHLLADAHGPHTAYSDVESEQDPEDVIFGLEEVDGPARDDLQPLLTADDVSESGFMLNCDDRFGSSHPFVFTGDLKDALRHASEQGKPLLVYLHDDRNDNADAIARRLFRNDNFNGFLLQWFTVWGWDMTYKYGRKALKDMCEGVVKLSDAIDGAFPCMFVLNKTRGGSTECLGSITDFEEPAVVQSDLLDKALLAQARHDAEQGHRTEREEMLDEQDAAFQESLRRDREKEREKQRAEAEAERQAVLQRQEELEKEQQQAAEANDIDQARARLKPEPEDGAYPFRFAFPDGTKEKRTFAATSTLKDLITYVTSKGFHPSKYNIFALEGPRKALVTQTDDKTPIDPLEQLQDIQHLKPRSTLRIEAREE